MFEIGQLIMYSSRGVCRVERIEPVSIDDGPEKDYYTLAPVFGKGIFRIPVDTKQFMRPIMTKEAAEAFVDSIADVEGEAYFNKNMTSLKEHYSSILQSHDPEKLIELIKGVYQKNTQAIKNGKTPAQIDKHYMEKAEEIINGELACALGIDKCMVHKYINDRINS